MKRTLGLLLAITILIFAPNLPFLMDGVLGATGSDAMKHVWSQWLVVHQLQSVEGLALETHLIHHPTGGSFFSLDTFNALIGLPFRTVFSTVFTYNLVLMLNLFFAAVCGSYLARHLTQDSWAQALGGTGFAFSAWVLSFPVASGVSETAVFWPIPLIILLAHKSWIEQHWRYPVAAGGLLSLQGVACWSHGITAGLLLLCMVAYSLKTNPMSWKQDGRVGRVAMLLGTALLVTIPGYLAISGTVSADDAIKTRTLSLFHSAPIGPLDALETNNMAISDFFAVGDWGLRTAAVGTDRLMYAANPGWILMGLALLAWKRNRSAVGIWVFGALLMLMLSLGPRIYLDHARSIGGIPNPVYLLSYWLIPLVNATIHSVDRFAVGLQLCVAMMAAIGVSTLSPRWRPVALIAITVELIAWSPAPWPIPMATASPHPASVHIQHIEDERAVLDIPFLEGDEDHQWFLGDVFLQQTTHTKPIPFQLEGRAMETVNPAVRANPFFEKFAAAAIQNRPIAAGCKGLTELANMGFGWVVWRPMLTPDARREEFRQRMDACLSITETYDDRILYEIPRVP